MGHRTEASMLPRGVGIRPRAKPNEMVRTVIYQEATPAHGKTEACQTGGSSLATGSLDIEKHGPFVRNGSGAIRESMPDRIGGQHGDG